ncbi:MAG: transposase [Gemmataceae bacterium]
MSTSPRGSYKTDLTDIQWEIIREFLPPAKTGGRPRAFDLREVVNTILHVLKTGCQWDMIPHDLVPKSNAYDYIGRWHDRFGPPKFDSIRARTTKPRADTQCRMRRFAKC